MRYRPARMPEGKTGPADKVNGLQAVGPIVADIAIGEGVATDRARMHHYGQQALVLVRWGVDEPFCLLGHACSRLQCSVL